MTQQDTIKWFPRFEVLKWSPDTVAEITAYLGHEPDSTELMALTGAPDDTAYGEGNALVTVGLNRITALITAIGSPQAFTNTRGVCGVGDSSAAINVAHTALQGTAGTGQYYVGLNASQPTQANGVISATADFAGGVANFAWNEWCWAIATAAVVASSSFATATTSGVMLNRAIQTLGTKASGAVWTLSASVTLT